MLSDPQNQNETNGLMQGGLKTKKKKNDRKILTKEDEANDIISGLYIGGARFKSRSGKPI
jgi:hypothetical protein